MDLTLLVVNWNQKKALELALRSYVRHHFINERLNLMLVDNGSTDGSKEWLFDNEIPFVNNPENFGHERALNQVYNMIQTQYCLLIDSDIEFDCDIVPYVYEHMIQENFKSAGELITRDHNIKPRISPWFWLFDIEAMRNAGSNVFRATDNTGWNYDVGSDHWERMQAAGFKNYHIPMIGGGVDEMPGMVYMWGTHFGKVSWNLENHGDRKHEVAQRHAIIEERLRLYEDIDLRSKFVI